ncbi:MAG: hypothetical protein QM699_01515 [Amaricoccus sp.]|uniref:hypothetical protein n=1 Tax=Amaricoccus sp. TaxID=1872485 RepID=UPI0039E3489D
MPSDLGLPRIRQADREIVRLERELAAAEAMLLDILIETSGKAIPNESLAACRSRALAFLERRNLPDG